MKDSLEQKIKRLRHTKGLTQDNMAYELGITKGAYNKIENGHTDISVKRLYEIANILDVDVLELLSPSTSNNKIEDTQKKYGFATKEDVEEIVKMVQQLAKEVSSLKAKASTPASKKKKTKQ